MKRILPFIAIITLLLTSCTSQKKLAYLNNLPEANGEESFAMELPDYKIQLRDILYITAKAMTSDGKIQDFLTSSGTMGGSQVQGEGGGYLYGYDVSTEGNILIPVIGLIKVGGFTVEEARNIIQGFVDKVYKNTTVECKLLSFKFTVIGEVRGPGTFINYNNYLTVFEAIGRAGGVGDYGNRNRVLVIRPEKGGSKTYRLNLQDKSILASEAYFLLPNDVVIVEPMKQKIFNLNLPTISFIISTVTSTISTTLLLVLFFKQ
jgi:polysaccharide export outer membrane protein